MGRWILNLSIVIAAVMMVCTGCKSNPKVKFSLQQRHVTITTDPPGATVTQINSLDESQTSLGTTPLNDVPVIILKDIRSTKNYPIAETQRLLSHVGNLVVRIDKAGYESSRHILRTDPEKTMDHNITLQPVSQ